MKNKNLDKMPRVSAQQVPDIHQTSIQYHQLSDPQKIRRITEVSKMVSTSLKREKSEEWQTYIREFFTNVATTEEIDRLFPGEKLHTECLTLFLLRYLGKPEAIKDSYEEVRNQTLAAIKRYPQAQSIALSNAFLTLAKHANVIENYPHANCFFLLSISHDNTSSIGSRVSSLVRSLRKTPKSVLPFPFEDFEKDLDPYLTCPAISRYSSLQEAAQAFAEAVHSVDTWYNRDDDPLMAPLYFQDFEAFYVVAGFAAPTSYPARDSEYFSKLSSVAIMRDKKDVLDMFQALVKFWKATIDPPCEKCANENCSDSVFITNACKAIDAIYLTYLPDGVSPTQFVSLINYAKRQKFSIAPVCCALSLPNSRLFMEGKYQTDHRELSIWLREKIPSLDTIGALIAELCCQILDPQADREEAIAKAMTKLLKTRCPRVRFPRNYEELRETLLEQYYEGLLTTLGLPDTFDRTYALHVYDLLKTCSITKKLQTLRLLINTFSNQQITNELLDLLYEDAKRLFDEKKYQDAFEVLKFAIDLKTSDRKWIVLGKPICEALPDDVDAKAFTPLLQFSGFVTQPNLSIWSIHKLYLHLVQRYQKERSALSVSYEEQLQRAKTSQETAEKTSSTMSKKNTQLHARLKRASNSLQEAQAIYEKEKETYRATIRALERELRAKPAAPDELKLHELTSDLRQKIAKLETDISEQQLAHEEDIARKKEALKHLTSKNQQLSEEVDRIQKELAQRDATIEEQQSTHLLHVREQRTDYEAAVEKHGRVIENLNRENARRFNWLQQKNKRLRAHNGALVHRVKQLTQELSMLKTPPTAMASPQEHTDASCLDWSRLEADLAALTGEPE